MRVVITARTQWRLLTERVKMKSEDKQISMFKKWDISPSPNTIKRNWENAFQKWSDKHGMDSENTESWGCCGYGSMCEWCEDNSYGRPCVRALNKMCREKGILINYSERDFEKIWQANIKYTTQEQERYARQRTLKP